MSTGSVSSSHIKIIDRAANREELEKLLQKVSCVRKSYRTTVLEATYIGPANIYRGNLAELNIDFPKTVHRGELYKTISSIYIFSAVMFGMFVYPLTVTFLALEGNRGWDLSKEEKTKIITWLVLGIVSSSFIIPCFCMNRYYKYKSSTVRDEIVQAAKSELLITARENAAERIKCLKDS